MILTTLVVLFVVALAVAYLRGQPIVTPIPKAVVAFFRRLGSGSLWLTLWRAFLVVSLLTIAGLMATAGGIIWGFIAAVIVSMLISDTVQEIVYDLWHANFVTVEP